MPKKIAIARPRSATGKASRTIASAAGNMIAAPAPWRTRKTISQASAPEPVGVAPQRAEQTAKTITPITTMRRWPAMSASRPPKAKSAESASRYPLMIHCDPVVERCTSCWIVGSEIATIVWSMKVIDTANIIAARISFEFLAGVAFTLKMIQEPSGYSSRKEASCPAGSLGCRLDAIYLLDRGRFRRPHLLHQLHDRRAFGHHDLRLRCRDGRLHGLHAGLPADRHRPRLELRRRHRG